jgi:hypothetical protein
MFDEYEMFGESVVFGKSVNFDENAGNLRYATERRLER